MSKKKERKSVTLDPEVAAYLSAEGRNASETVNKLVKMEMNDEAMNDQILRMRMEMEKDRYEDAAQKARGHLQRYNQLKDELESHTSQEQKREEIIQQVAAEVKPDMWLSIQTKEEQLPSVSHEAFQQNAERVNMTPREFRQKVVTYLTEEEDA